jgi:multiple sugar transport system permease protein
MDGAGIFRIMFQVVFPIQKPILAYVAITTGVAVWNDWYTPFVYSNNPTYQTLASAVSKLTSVAIGQYGIPDWPNIITLGLGLTLPSLVMFAFFQRYIVMGLASAAVKG